MKLLTAVLFAGVCSWAGADGGPKSAADCNRQGQALRRRGDEPSLVQAANWLGQAVHLAPDNADYVYDYGQVCFRLADLKRSVTYAIHARDAMKRTIELNPGQLDARASLMEFYARAPWPLGSPARALGQADEIGRRDKLRGASVDLQLFEIFTSKNDRTEALAACRAALKFDPANAAAAAALARLRTP